MKQLARKILMTLLTVYQLFQCIYIGEENLVNYIPFSVKYQFSDIGWSNQLSTKHKRCIFKQTRSFAGNILERRTHANKDKL